MAQVVTVTALEHFRHGVRPVAPGDLVECSVVQAIQWANQRLVTLTRHAIVVPKVAKPEPPPVAPPRRRRTYRRKDMVAEPA